MKGNDWKDMEEKQSKVNLFIYISIPCDDALASRPVTAGDRHKPCCDVPPLKYCLSLTQDSFIQRAQQIFGIAKMLLGQM